MLRRVVHLLGRHRRAAQVLAAAALRCEAGSGWSAGAGAQALHVATVLPACVPPADFRDSAPEQLRHVYELYQPVVKNGRCAGQGVEPAACGRHA